MSRRPPRRLVASSVVAAAAVALCACAVSNPNAATQPTATTTTPTPATRIAAASALTSAQINRQDRPSRRLLRLQRAASAARPMLSALPITTRGVTIVIAGLAGDGRTTLLSVRSRRGRAHARVVYRHELRRYGDTGHAYRLVFER
jgi:Flp pilus assembly CpaF family ATPase